MEDSTDVPSNIRHAAYYYLNREKILEKNRIRREQKKKELEELRKLPEYIEKEEAKKREKEKLLEQKRKDIEVQHMLAIESKRLENDLIKEEGKLKSIEELYNNTKEKINKIKESLVSIEKLRNVRD